MVSAWLKSCVTHSDLYPGFQVWRRATRYLAHDCVPPSALTDSYIGPARFSHMEKCAQEVCRAFKLKEGIEDCISTLTTLDDILAGLRFDLSKAISDHGIEPSSSTSAEKASGTRTSKKQDYSGLHTAHDLVKAKRLVNARENAIKSVKVLISKKEQET